MENPLQEWGGSGFRQGWESSDIWGGGWGHAPPGKFGIFDLQRVLLRPSDSSLRLFLSIFKIYTFEKWGGSAPPPTFQSGGARAPLAPPHFSAYVYGRNSLQGWVPCRILIEYNIIAHQCMHAWYRCIHKKCPSKSDQFTTDCHYCLH